jgi:addiction module HigA family antidote
MKSNHDISAIPPETVIWEQIRMHNMKKEEFTDKMFLSKENADSLLNGKMKLTYDIALRLKHVFGNSTDFWLNLESAYRKNKSELFK